MKRQKTEPSLDFKSFLIVCVFTCQHFLDLHNSNVWPQFLKFLTTSKLDSYNCKNVSQDNQQQERTKNLPQLIAIVKVSSTSKTKRKKKVKKKHFFTFYGFLVEKESCRKLEISAASRLSNKKSILNKMFGRGIKKVKKNNKMITNVTK